MATGGPDWITGLRVLEAPKATGQYNQATVNAAATLILAANSGRQSVTMVNISDTDIRVGLDANLTWANGSLFPAYSNLVIVAYTGPIYAIVNSGSGSLSYIEM